MVKLLAISLLFFTLFSCSGKKVVEDDPNTEIVENFRISGNIEGASSLTIYLEALTPQGTVPVANCETDADGEFDMLGNIPDMGVYQLRLGDQQDKIVTLPLVPKDNLTLTSKMKDFATSPHFEGTEWAENLTKYMTLFNEFASKQQSLAALQGKVSEQELMAKYMALRSPIDDFAREAVNKDPGNAVNFLLSSTLSPNVGFKEWNPENMKVLKKMSTAYTKKYKDSPIAKRMAEQVVMIENGYKQFLEINSGSRMAPEMALNNPDGKIIKLSSLRGKYVLIDFWASWCAPCRKENPNVVRLYNQYKDKGFTIYSVSLDKDVAAWKDAIATDGLVWPNHVSDLSGWESNLPTLYGFQGIPYTVLVDKEGKIIETGLRGPSLEQKLKELIKN